MGEKTILEVKNLRIHYETDAGVVEALNGVDISIDEGSIIGLVGETGAGKTTLAKGIMRLTRVPPGKIVEGEILYEGKDLLKANDAEMRRIRGKQISMIFQDPMTSLNPVLTVGEQIAESIKNHEDISPQDAKKKAEEMLEMVGISSERASDYPHQFSGGMKQRVVIAIALACNPKILIADEPTTALDVTIQAQVLELMAKLRKQFNTAMLLITHDMGVVAQTCEKVAIIYAGKIVESGTAQDVFKRMVHPYTIGLLNCIPKIHEDVHRLSPIDGLMPDPMNLPAGCAFCDRCSFVQERCRHDAPPMYHIEGTHYARCFLLDGHEKEET